MSVGRITYRVPEFPCCRCCRRSSGYTSPVVPSCGTPIAMLRCCHSPWWYFLQPSGPHGVLDGGGGAQPRTSGASGRDERGWVAVPGSLSDLMMWRPLGAEPPSRHLRATAQEGSFDVQHPGDQRLGSGDPRGADRERDDFRVLPGII